MKYRRQLSSAVEMYDPEWSPFWLSYKTLKKKLTLCAKEVCDPAEEGLVIELRKKHTKDQIKRFPSEVLFFRVMKQELCKCSKFYLSDEAQLSARLERLREGYQVVKASRDLGKENHRALLKACTNLYTDLVKLENFAILNIVGISKILKKHDKVTGFLTRDGFMKMAFSSSLAQHHNIRAMANGVEELYRVIFEALEGESKAKYTEEELLFVYAMQRICTETHKLRAKEWTAVDNVPRLISSTSSSGQHTYTTPSSVDLNTRVYMPQGYRAGSPSHSALTLKREASHVDEHEGRSKRVRVSSSQSELIVPEKAVKVEE